jgi:MoaA/NifB/PqqE/SkfB family radical SAM enzyme
MKVRDVFPAWMRILKGQRPLLSLEITKECPLRCPGCYAYEFGHLAEAGPLRDLSDFRGDALVSGVLTLLRRYRPIHLSIVGGEPLVRYRELEVLLPQIERMGIEVQLVTSAVRPIPAAWANLPNLHLVVSIDGLQPEHDRRRAPATYDRILKHIAGHKLIVHCTITRQLLQRPGYLEEFTAFWSGRDEVRKIWFSLFTPQQGDELEERLTPDDRRAVVREITRIRDKFPKLYMPDVVLDGYLHPPANPDDCIFAQTTACVSADLTTKITPCQFGGKPVCTECGCVASAGFASIGKYKLGGLVRVSDIFRASKNLGEALASGRGYALRPGSAELPSA